MPPLTQLGDMGVSKIVKNAVASQNTRVGTPLYLAPELIKQKPYDYKIDVWALGCILYQLCTGKSPFSGENLISLGYNIVHTQQPSISSSYSKELQELINLLMEKNPSKRLSSEEALAFIQNHNKARQIPPNLQSKPVTSSSNPRQPGPITKIDHSNDQAQGHKSHQSNGPKASIGSKHVLDRPTDSSSQLNHVDGLAEPIPSLNAPLTGQKKGHVSTTSAANQHHQDLVNTPALPEQLKHGPNLEPEAVVNISPHPTPSKSIRRPPLHKQALGEGLVPEPIEKSLKEQPYQNNSRMGSQESLAKGIQHPGSPGQSFTAGQERSNRIQSKREDSANSGALKISNYIKAPVREEHLPSSVVNQGGQMNPTRTVPTAGAPAQRPATAGVPRGRPTSRYSNKDQAAHAEDGNKNRYSAAPNRGVGDRMKAMEIMLKRATIDDPVCAVLKQNSASRQLEVRNPSPVHQKKLVTPADNQQGQLIRIGSPSGIGRGRPGYLTTNETSSYRNQSTSVINGPSTSTKPAGNFSHKNDLELDEVASNPFPSATMASLAPGPVVIKPAISHPFLDPYRAIFSGVMASERAEEEFPKESESKKRSDIFSKKQRPQTASANLQAGDGSAQNRYNSAAMMKVHPGGYLTRGSLNMNSGTGLTVQQGSAPNQSQNYRIKSSTQQTANPVVAGSRPATAGGMNFLPPFQSTDSASQQIRFKKFTVNDI